MRIGTWNLAGRWDGRQKRLMEEQECDVWLLTEVSERVAIEGYARHMTAACMARQRRWAAILSREALEPRTDPHPASALASVGPMLFCSSILPWRSCGSRHPWVGATHAEKTRTAIDELLTTLPKSRLFWGGDWNHALSGKEFSGSQGGRLQILGAIATLGLQVPTAKLPHRLPGLLTIDHVAVPHRAVTSAARRVVGGEAGQRLSDHDAYVTEVEVA